MPEHLRALIVLLPVAILVFALGKRIACPVAIDENDYRRRRNLWFGITLAAFLSHSFWIFMIFAGALLVWGARREQNKLALYFFLFFAMPMMAERVPGFGVINYFFEIHYGRLLSLVLLLPLFLSAGSAKEPRVKFGRHVQDKLLLAYLALLFMLQLNVDTFTNTLRHSVFYAFLDVFLPYYVASRSLRSLKDFHDVLMSLVVGCMVLAAVALLEWGRGWLLYAPLENALGIVWAYGNYLGRGDFLRAVGTTGQPIALGYALVTAFALFLSFGRSIKRPVFWHAGLAVLAVGLLASMSRAPWLGAALVLLVFMITSPHALMNLARLAVLAAIALMALAATPAWEKIIDYLPFVGSVDAENVTYREFLLYAIINIILDNPLFGSYEAMLYLQEFRTGEGIVDIVNTYLGIGLESGLTGLSLFVGFFFISGYGVYRAMRRHPLDSEMRYLGRALLAALVGVLFIIFTVSSITVIPYIYWSLAGMAVAYIRLATGAARDIAVTIPMPQVSWQRPSKPVAGAA